MSTQKPTTRRLVLSRETVLSLTPGTRAGFDSADTCGCSSRCLHLSYEASACNSQIC